MRFFFTRKIVSGLTSVDKRQRRIGLRKQQRLLLEVLEDRVCPSVFYDFDVIGQTGQSGLTGILQGASVNDAGKVAFVGTVNGGQSIFVGDGSSAPTNITPSFVGTSRTFGAELQINNTNQVAAVDRTVLTGFTGYEARIWDATATDSWTEIGKGAITANKPVGYFDALGMFTSISNDGNLAFAGLEGSTWEFHDSNSLVKEGVSSGTTSDPTFETTLPSGTFFRQQAANGNALVLGWRSSSTKEIDLFNGSTPTVIAQTGSGWTDLGVRPGISDDGAIVVFEGDRGQGPGIFASLDLGAGRTIIRLVGENGGAAGTQHTDLGYDAAGNPLYFNAFNVDSRVGITDLPLGVAGLQDDSFVVSFMGTPNAASRANPIVAAGGVPLFFSSQQGIWSIRADIERQLQAPNNLVVHQTGTLPVVQIGDKIAGDTVNSLAMGDSLGQATKDQQGAVRTPRRGDHYLAFWASTSGGDKVVRAAHLCSSEDGLLDHWKTKGIDIDQDGVVDLNLAAMGAKVGQRDLFMEIDWTQPRTSGVPTNWSNEPAAGVTQWLVNMFAAAPALADGIPANIHLHIDAGPGSDTSGNAFSQNMKAGPLEGGDLIGQTGSSSTHLDVVYFGLPGSLTVPGVQTRDFESIKESYFGTTDKWARELAFHYVVMADFQDFIRTARTNPPSPPFTANVTAATNATLTSATPLPPDPFGSADLGGHAVEITSGTGQGQVRLLTAPSTVGGNLLTVTQPWSTPPDNTSTFALLNGSSGLGEVFFYSNPDANSIPGNDNLITMGGFGVNRKGWLASTRDQERTLAHELGHTLGLRHGGIDHNAHKGNQYLSLMSYDWQTAPQAPAPGINVNSYSGATDPTFNDWANLQLDFQNAAIHLGNTFNQGFKGSTSDVDDSELNVFQYVTLKGVPIDLQGPTVSIDAPGSGGNVAIGSDLTVAITAADDVAVDVVQVEFDINGNGTIDPGETVAASLVGANSYSATFANIQGSSGSRAIRVTATDTSDNPTVVSGSVQVGATASNLSVADFTPTPSGFTIDFNKAFDPTTVNLYTNGSLPDDVILATRGSQVSVRGSLVINSNNTGFTFVKTAAASALGTFNPSNGLLAAGIYTVTLRAFSAGHGGFQDTLGNPLDGTNSGTPGTNYQVTFTASAPPVAVGIPAFARGPSNTDAIFLSPTLSEGSTFALSYTNPAANPTTGTATVTFSTNAATLQSNIRAALSFGDLATQIGFTGAIPNSVVIVTNDTSTGANVLVTFQSPLAQATNQLLSSSTAGVSIGAATIDVPNNLPGSGIPIALSNGLNVTSGVFTLQYNPSLLTISGAVSKIPGASFALVSNDTVTGTAVLSLSSAVRISAAVAPITLGSLLATVPLSATASYGAKQLLHFSSEQLNGTAGPISVTNEDAVQVAAYLGDVTDLGGPLALNDAVAIATAGSAVPNTAAQTIPGFAAFPNIDPTIIGDVSLQGIVNSTDAGAMLQEVGGIARITIPYAPIGLSITPAGSSAPATAASSVMSTAAVVQPVPASAAIPLVEHLARLGETRVFTAWELIGPKGQVVNWQVPPANPTLTETVASGSIPALQTSAQVDWLAVNLLASLGQRTEIALPWDDDADLALLLDATRRGT